MSNQPQGIYRKFNVSRTDGRDQPGGDRAGAEYFVLDLTYDPFAIAALRLYAAAVRSEYPDLSNDLQQKTAGASAPFFDLIAHILRQREFSKRTFGPGARTAGVCDHIRKELVEVEANPSDVTEWADVILLALDGAWRAGFTPGQIAAAIDAKQTKNERRTWPDWRTTDPNKAIEHVREQAA